MKTYYNITDFQPIQQKKTLRSGEGLGGAIVTIGTFDGVHLGHRQIISRVVDLAEKTGGESVILTFFPHPRMILKPEDQDIKLITTIDEKARLLEDLGVDNLIITPFSRDFSNQNAEDYIRDVLVNRIGTKKIVIGYDHRFGKDRAGGLQDLQNLANIYGYEVIEIPEQDINEVAVSSTQIRQALLAGDINKANKFLGYPFFITGKVIKGDQLGRQLGYPTANLSIEERYKLIPADGIYAVMVEVKGSKYKGMAYIGHRPTINGMTRNIEVNIFDFDSDVYNQTVRMEFLHFVRDDIKFASLDDLVIQLGEDKKDVAAMLMSSRV